MSRLDYVTIAIVAVCVAALIYLIYMTTNLVGGPDEPAVTEDTNFSNEDNSTYRDTSYYYDDEGTGQDDVTSEGLSNTGSSGNIAEEELDKSPVATRTEKETRPVEEYAPTRTTSTGNYMVLAGTFSVKAYAAEMVDKLHGMGYTDAAAESFDRGKFTVVLVGRFNSLGDAKNLVTELKGKGVDAYVKKK